MLYLLLLIAPLILGFVAQRKVSGTFAKWSDVPSTSGRTGAEVARAILDRNGLMDVEVRPTPGVLSDHYDPRNRTVNLSEAVFASRSVSAVSVAAHEVGHAIQHKEQYAPLQIRSALVPVATLGSNAFMPLFFLGIVMASAGAVLGQWMILAAIGLYAFAVLFQVVTLPVEFDASKRARVQMQDMTLLPAGGNEAVGVRQVLGSAALTYVAAALASIAQLMYFVLQFVMPRD